MVYATELHMCTQMLSKPHYLPFVLGGPLPRNQISSYWWLWKGFKGFAFNRGPWTLSCLSPSVLPSQPLEWFLPSLSLTPNSCLKVLLRSDFTFFFFPAMHAACGSSRVRDCTCTTAATPFAAVTTAGYLTHGTTREFWGAFTLNGSKETLCVLLFCQNHFLEILS